MQAMMYGAMVVILALSAGCDGSFLGTPGSGVAATQDRTGPDFHALSVSGSGDVTVTVGGEKSVAVTLDDNLIDLVNTEVVDGELRISSSGSYSTQLGLDVQITVPSLDAVSISGVVNLTASSITGPAMNVESNGVGSITMDGEVDKLDVAVSGVGNVMLKDLIAKKVKVRSSGTGGATVYASKSVDAEASGTSKIKVHGKPADVKKSSSGVGSVEIK